jgi:hypothetical protein
MLTACRQANGTMRASRRRVANMRTRITPAASAGASGPEGPGSIGATSQAFRTGVVRNFPFAFGPRPPVMPAGRCWLSSFHRGCCWFRKRIDRLA